MPTRILLAFANPAGEERLPQLDEEYAGVSNELRGPTLAGRVEVTPEQHATTANLVRYLEDFKDQVSIFLYSGHAGPGQLHLEGQDANGKGVTMLLGECARRQLKVVVLNGCSTNGMVKGMLEAGVPVVIATSAPVNDRSAKAFSVSFFKALAQDLPVFDAYQSGIRAAQTASAADLTATLQLRGSLDLEEGNDVGTWGIFCKIENESVARNWRLPPAIINPQTKEYQINVELTDAVIKGLAKYKEEAKDLESTSKAEDLDLKSELILRSFPYFIAQDIQRLFATSEVGGLGGTFCDKPDLVRLRQLIGTYSNTLEFITYILLSQLWESRTGAGSIQLTDAQKVTLRDFLKPGPVQKDYDFRPIVNHLLDILEKEQLTLFLTQLATLENSLTLDSPMTRAVDYLQARQKELAVRDQFSAADLVQLCYETEKQLGIFLHHLCFLSLYSLASVRNISVHKARYLQRPRFKHKVVELTFRIGISAQERKRELEDFLEDSSVLLKKEEIRSTRVDFLNLSPFVLDENAFNLKSGNNQSKIYFYEHRQGDNFYYRHLYKPNDPLLQIPDVTKEGFDFSEYGGILTKQFDALCQLLFQQNQSAL